MQVSKSGKGGDGDGSGVGGRSPVADELLISCRRCGRAFWTGIAIPPPLRDEAPVPGDTYACPFGHVEDYADDDMFYDRRGADAVRDADYVHGSIDRRSRARRAGEI